MIYYIIVQDGIITQKGYSNKDLSDVMTPVSKNEYNTLDIGDTFS